MSSFCPVAARELATIDEAASDAIVLEADLVIAGAGMAGLTAAARAAELGLRVLVVEKAERAGGSAALSGGFVWTVDDIEELVAQDPAGDDALGRALIEEFPARIAWLPTIGVEIGPTVRILSGHGHQIDVAQLIARTRALVEATDGHILPAVTRAEPLVDAGRLAGLVVHRGGEAAVLRAPSICLATGGFQADPELVAGYVGARPGQVHLRSNPHSTGDGIAIGLALGGVLTGSSMANFYGHLFPSPLPDLRPTPTDYTLLSQFHSEQGILLDRHGLRFTDESRLDHENAISVLRTEGARAVLVIDERVRREVVLPAFAPGLETGVDKMAHAGDLGARYASVTTLDEVARVVAAWGLPEATTRGTLERFNEAVRAGRGDTLRPPRAGFATAIEEPPFAVLEVAPAITFTYGGLWCDRHSRVLGADAAPVPGVLAAGADMGGVYQHGYAGGLARGLVFGALAAETAARSDRA